jgi:hypothetical protein
VFRHCSISEVSFMTDESLTVITYSDSLKWLSDRQYDRPAPPDGDPLVGYCRQLEEVVVRQSAEIEALREMIQSEHDRNALMPPPPGDILAGLITPVFPPKHAFVTMFPNAPKIMPPSCVAGQ